MTHKQDTRECHGRHVVLMTLILSKGLLLLHRLFNSKCVTPVYSSDLMVQMVTCIFIKIAIETGIFHVKHFECIIPSKYNDRQCKTKRRIGLQELLANLKISKPHLLTTSAMGITSDNDLFLTHSTTWRRTFQRYQLHVFCTVYF